MKRLAISLVLIALFTSHAFAATKAEPEAESYVSLTLLAGVGTETDRFGDGDVTSLSAALDYPISEEFTLLARVDHEQTRWDSLLWRSRCLPLLDESTGRNLFSFGMRVNFK